MALRLILGPSGSGRSRMLFTRALSQAQAHPDRRYIVLVPEQFTLQTQRDLVELSDRNGILNIDVLSFTRLAYRVFEQTGIARRAVLSETGKSLMLRLIASREEQQLGILSGILDKPGVISEAKSILSELDQYGITPQKLEETRQKILRAGGRGALARKLGEIRSLQEAFEEYQAGHFITGEKLPRLLSQKVPLDPTLRGAEFYLDGYTGFTPAQMEVISALLSVARDVTVTVAIDPAETGILPGAAVRERAQRAASGHGLFALSARTICALTDAAQSVGAEVAEPVFTDPDAGRQKSGSPLAWLESHLFRSGRQAHAPYREEGKEQQIIFRQCADPYDEVVSAAVTIRKLVRGGMRFRDIAIVCGSLKEYAEYARRVLAQYEIPCFVDRSSPVLLNPAFEFVESAIDIPEKNFSYESVMRFLRTGLVLDDEGGETDLLDNYLIAAGIRGRKAWSEPFFRQTNDRDEALLETAERARSFFMERFTPFLEVMKKGKAKVSERARAVWDLLLAFDVPGRMEELRERCEAEGRADRAEEYAQVMQVIADVLDEAALLIGEEPVTRTQFTQILRAGFSEAKIGIIPPGTDQVHVGDLQRTRLEHVRALIFLGLNDGLVPERKTQGGFLTDMEREYLLREQVRLAPTAREDADIQRFYLYLTLTKPSDLLILSWSEFSRGAEQRRRSYVADQILELFPDSPVEGGMSGDPFGAVVSPRTALSVLAGSLSQYMESGAQAAREKEGHLRELLRFCADPSGGMRERAEEILRAAAGGAPDVQLDAKTAGELYGSVLHGSITRLEEYFQCPFRHFAHYGLGLEEREEFEVQTPDIGSLLHSAVEIFSRRLREEQQGYTWRTIPDPVRDLWAEQALEEAALAQRPGLYEDSERSRNILDRCRGIMKRSVRTLQRQICAGQFVPSRFEVRFGAGETEALQITDLPGGHSMSLRGRIDRIDLCDDPGARTLYVRIIDYKSSARKLDLDSFLDGEQLQLVVYMDAAARMEQAAHPDRSVVCAGIFYYAFGNPILNEEDAGEDLEDAFAKKMMVQGLLNGSPEVVRRLDSSLAPSRNSLVIPVHMNADGTLKAADSIADSGKLDAMRQYAGQKMRAAAESILEGDIRPLPYRRSDNDTACAWCPYGDVCRFDPRSGMPYNDRERRSDAQRWEILRSAQRDAEEEDG